MNAESVLNASTVEICQSLKLFHEALFLPIYLYRGKTLVASFSEKAATYPPPAFYLTKEARKKDGSAYVETPFHSVYGYLPLERDPELFVMVGPVSPAPYTQDDFRRFFTDFRIPPQLRDDCQVFFQNIPRYMIEDFGKILRLLNHLLGNRTEPDTNWTSEAVTPVRVHQQSVLNAYEQNYRYESNESLLYEKVMTDIIERGQVEKLKELESDFWLFNKGTLAKESLRNMKNLTIVCVAIFCRAAIRAGVNSQIAFQMSDQFIMKAEAGLTIDEVADQVVHSLTAYTTEVANLRREVSRDTKFQSIISYVREHTNFPISTSHIAAEFGYNSNYLSGLFKKEIGISLSDFIMRTKLEESCELLLYTKKSILEISEYLCFCSQSYFQRAFKKQYGVTPMQYRKAGVAK